MGRKILSIVFIISSIIFLNLSNKALAALHQNSEMAVIYIVLFIISMVFAWVSVTSPAMPKAMPQIATAPVQQKEAGKKSGYATASLILGLLSFIPAIGVFLGLLAVVLGAIALKHIKEKGLTGKGMAIFGIILGIFGIFTSSIFVIYLGMRQS